MAAILSEATCKRAELLSRFHTDATVTELVGISRSTLWALKRRDFRSAARTPRQRPSDFAIQANYMCRDALSRHYQASNKTTDRWLSEVGRRR